MADGRHPPSSHFANGEARDRAAEPTYAVLTIDELAVHLKLPKGMLYELARKGMVPGHRVGRHWRLNRVTIGRWLEESTLEHSNA
jgi:excisionase family DNA binding protein